jgi:hypothetical protein
VSSSTSIEGVGAKEPGQKASVGVRPLSGIEEEGNDVAVAGPNCSLRSTTPMPGDNRSLCTEEGVERLQCI